MLICSTCGVEFAKESPDWIFDRDEWWHKPCARRFLFYEVPYVDFPSDGKGIPETLMTDETGRLNMLEAIVKVEAIVRVELSNNGTQLIIRICPFCGHTHYHGAGLKTGEQYPLYGKRVAHCRSDQLPEQLRTPSLSYCLVPLTNELAL